MPSGDFTLAADPTHSVFRHPLGRMLLGFNEINSDEYNRVGQAQVRTVVLAETFDRHPELRPQILAKFGARNNPAELDINNAMFGYNRDNIVPELDQFIAGLNVPDLDTKMQKAKETVAAEKGVHPAAAASGVLHKSLFLKREERNDVVNASLIMQHAARGLERIEALRSGKPDRQAAVDLVGTCNKLSYKFDPPALVDANEALLSICTSEMKIGTAFSRAAAEGPDLRTLSTRHEALLHSDMMALLNALPEAVKMYEKAGRTGLAEKARSAQAYYLEKFAPTFVIAPPAPADAPKPA